MNWNLFFNKVRNKIFFFVDALIRPRRIFVSEVMNFRFIKFKRKKNKYDISKHYYTFSLKNKDDIYKYLFSVLMLFFLFLIPFMAKDIGLSDDEIRKNENAKALFEYYQNGNQAVKEIGDFKYQGQFVDNLACLVNQLFHVKDFLVTRHIINSLFAWLTLLFTGILLLRLFFWRAAFFGILFLFISPRFLGQAFYNLVDIPFAFAYIFVISQIIFLCLDFPIIRWNRIIRITLGISLAVMISAAGYVLIFYLFAFILLYFISRNPVRKFFTLRYLKNLFLITALLSGITIVVYLIDFLYLPSFLQPQTVNPFEAIALLKNNIVQTIQLFEGQFYQTSELPAHYLVKLLFFTIPMVILLTFFIHFLLIRQVVRVTGILPEILLLFSFFYPLFIGTHLNITPSHDWSIFLFIYPVLIVIAVAGLEAILRKIDDIYTNIVIVAIVALLSFMPLRHIIFNHPISYVYYNEISGGIDNAYGKYELDYNEHINKKVAGSFLKYISNSNTISNSLQTGKIKVYTDGGKGIDYYFRNDTAMIEIEHLPYQKLDSTLHWDYYISFANRKNSADLKNKTWLKEETLKTYEIEGKPVAALFKNKADSVMTVQK